MFGRCILISLLGASAIAYATIVTVIFSIRYLDVFRWAFKLTWMVLGVTVAAEVAGKTILNNGLASQVRPRKYYTVPRETLDSMIGDVNELVNFFVIEAQRILFAENVYASAAVSPNPCPLPDLVCEIWPTNFCRLPSLPSFPTTLSRSFLTGDCL